MAIGLGVGLAIAAALLAISLWLCLRRNKTGFQCATAVTRYGRGVEINKAGISGIRFLRQTKTCGVED